MGYQYGMTFEGQAKASYNSVVLATHKEAEGAARELMTRWFSPTGWEITKTDKEVNYEFKDWILTPIRCELTHTNCSIEKDRVK
jgi:hypothetical protein